MIDLSQFQPVKGNTDYLIDKNGLIYSTKVNRIMKPQKHKEGYSIIQLNLKHYLIHRLLAIQFIPNPESKPQVNHKDSNRANNALENLEWCTHAENMQHSYRNGRKNTKWHKRPAVKNRKMDFHHAETIRIMDKRGYTYHDISQIFPMSSTSYYKIIKNLTWI
jgi:HNH endonuclease